MVGGVTYEMSCSSAPLSDAARGADERSRPMCLVCDEHYDTINSPQQQQQLRGGDDAGMQELQND